MPKKIRSSDIKIVGTKKFSPTQATLLVNSITGLTDDQEAIMKNILTNDKALSKMGMTREEAITQLANEIQRDAIQQAVLQVFRDNGLMS